jgi:hypothetical protein
MILAVVPDEKAPLAAGLKTDRRRAERVLSQTPANRI